jgi:hypothetical protein
LSARVEDAPNEIDKLRGKFLPTELPATSDPLRDLNRAMFLVRTEFRPSDTVGDLKSEVFSAKFETKESEPAADLK